MSQSNSLSWLKKVQVVEEITKPATERKGTPGPRKQRNPNPALLAVRVFYDGSVFPSQALVDKFGLEYKQAIVTQEPLPLKDSAEEAKMKTTYSFADNNAGTGFDLIDSRVWGQYPKDAEGNLLLVAAVPRVDTKGKATPKVDLFGSTKFDESGKPKASVMDQGSATFGTDVLVPAIEEVYGIQFKRAAAKGDDAAREGVEFVDMIVVESLGTGADAFDLSEHFSRPKLYAPKRIVRGAEKGKADFELRENARLYGFMPISLVYPELVAEAQVSTETDQEPSAPQAETDDQTSVAVGAEAEA